MPTIRTLTLAAALAALAPAAAQAQAAKGATPAPAAAAHAVDFSGRWEMNAAESNFGEAAPQAPSSVVMTVTQTGAAVKVAQEIGMGGRTMSHTSDYTVDGKEVTSTGGDGMPMTTSARMLGDTLAIDARMQRQGMDLTQASRWVMAPDGKRMTVTQDMKSPMGAMSMSIVFDRK